MAADPIYDAWQEFAEAANRWVRFLETLSPASPDYEAQTEAAWYELKVGERFRKVQETITGR